MLVSKDGGASFQPTSSPATGVTSIAHPVNGNTSVLPGGTFPGHHRSDGVRIRVDGRGGVGRQPRGRLAYLLRAVAEWWGDLDDGPVGSAAAFRGRCSSNMQHFHPQIVVAPDGVIGCAFYEFGPKPTKQLIDLIVAQSYDGGASFDHFTVTDAGVGPDGRRAVGARQLRRDVHRRLHRTRRQRARVHSRLDGHAHAGPEPLDGDRAGASLLVRDQQEHHRPG